MALSQGSKQLFFCGDGQIIYQLALNSGKVMNKILLRYTPVALDLTLNNDSLAVGCSNSSLIILRPTNLKIL